MFMLSANEVDVKVWVLEGQSPNYRFESPIWINNQLVFQNNGHEGFHVHFKLQDAQYYFAKGKDMALAAAKLVNPGDECPDQGRKWNQFNEVGLSSDLKVMTVNNPNAPGQKSLFGFSLFVTKDKNGSGPYIKLDPIGDNQDGPVHYNVWAVATATVITVAIVALGLYAFGFFGR
jgi:hypothetical protein